MDWLSQLSSKHIFCLVLMWLDHCFASTKVYTIESSKVCSPINKRHIHLGVADASSAIVKETRYFDTPLENDFHCKFKVETAKTALGSSLYPMYTEDGLFAVIQTLSLRQEHSTGRCIDYVQFRSDGASWSRTFCGQMSLSDALPLAPVGDLAPFAVTNSHGTINVIIHVDKKPLGRGETLDLSIAFTAFKECRDRPGYLPCTRSEEEQGPGARTCIWHGLFNDSVANCPYRGCPDEPLGFCHQTGDTGSSSNAMLVALSALASLVIAFAVFLMVLWALRKLGRACWGPCARPRPRPSTPTPPVSMPLQPLGPNAPTAPPSPDKDPPPTYDSLFPVP